MGFGHQVTQGRTERPGQHERHPEQDHGRNPGEVFERDHHGNGRADQQRATGKTQARIIGQVVAERGPQGVGKQNRHPVEHLAPKGLHLADVQRIAAQAPGREDRQQNRNQDHRSGGVAQFKGAVHEVGHGGAGGAGRQNHDPVQQRLVGLGHQLGDQGQHEHADQDQRAEGVTDVEGHRQQVPRGFPQGRRADFHDPERQGDLRQFVHRKQSSSVRRLVLGFLAVGRLALHR